MSTIGQRIKSSRKDVNLSLVKVSELTGLSTGNLSDLEKNFKEGETVSLKTLSEKKLITKNQKKVKILGKGKLTKSLIVEDCRLSKKAKELIEKHAK